MFFYMNQIRKLSMTMTRLYHTTTIFLLGFTSEECGNKTWKINQKKTGLWWTCWTNKHGAIKKPAQCQLKITSPQLHCLNFETAHYGVVNTMNHELVPGPLWFTPRKNCHSDHGVQDSQRHFKAYISTDMVQRVLRWEKHSRCFSRKR